MGVAQSLKKQHQFALIFHPFGSKFVKFSPVWGIARNVFVMYICSEKLIKRYRAILKHTTYHTAIASYNPAH